MRSRRPHLSSSSRPALPCLVDLVLPCRSCLVLSSHRSVLFFLAQNPVVPADRRRPSHRVAAPAHHSPPPGCPLVQSPLVACHRSPSSQFPVRYLQPWRPSLDTVTFSLCICPLLALQLPTSQPPPLHPSYLATSFFLSQKRRHIATRSPVRHHPSLSAHMSTSLHPSPPVPDDRASKTAIAATLISSRWECII